MIKIISFDVSTVSTGWSYFEDGKLKDFGLIQPSDKYSMPGKLYWFGNNMEALLKIHTPDYVIVEDTYLKNVRTLKALMQFISVVNLKSFEAIGKDPVLLNTNTVRSYFELRTKEDVFSYVKDKYKVKLKHIVFDGGGNDITDSILMGLYWNEILKEK